MTTEAELVIPTLEILANADGGSMTTGELRQEIRKRVTLSLEDLEPLRGRPDQKIDQRIRNLKSHRKSVGNPIFEGLIEDVPKGFSITKRGYRVIGRKAPS